jgi:DNA (cytosine-5)-methyltransferase 1
VIQQLDRVGVYGYTTIALDLFAGVGWDIAARELGINPLGIDIDQDVCATREACGMWTLRADVSALNPEDFRPCVLFIASPPCPTFSAAGKGSGRLLTDVIVQCMDDLAAGADTRSMHVDDAYFVLEPVAWEREQKRASRQQREPDHERAHDQAMRDANMSMLSVEPLRWVLCLRPELVVLEQVPTVLPIWVEMARILGACGYSTWTGTLNSECYGVPQTRKRAILMASLSGVVRPPAATHQRFVSGKPAQHDDEVLPWVSMAEALGWGMTGRPCVTVGADSERHALDGGSGSRVALKRERDRGAWADSPVAYRNGNQRNSAVRPVHEPAPTLHFGPRCNEVTWTLVNNANTNAARRDATEPAPTITAAHDHGVYDRRYGGRGANLEERNVGLPVPTLTAQGLAKGRDVWVHERPATTVNGDARISAPGHHDEHESGSQQKNAVRVTVEEAAILQSFPPDMLWQGSKTAKFRQIGNAVPPLLARAILIALLASSAQSGSDYAEVA